MQKNVVIKLRTENLTGRHILAGILKRIGNDGNRCTIHITSDTEDFRRLSISASAIIADTTADADILQTAIAGGKTVVLLNDWRFKDHPPNLGHIRTDDGEIGFKAADYFMSIGKFRSFGYIPYRESEKEWSVKRRRAFALRLKGKGHECHTFGMDGDGNLNLGGWLKALPKPAAVLCAWDAVAAETANAARKAKIHIPSQIVLLGVDNDEVHCTSSQPQISSIEFDAEREGFTAADLMLKMLDTRKGNVSRSICCGGVTRIVERESTRPPVPAAHLGISRTLLDLRFREMESRTVGELITERRLSILSAMLKKSKIPAVRLTKECGFGNINHAKAVFKKHFGMTMREWRRKNKS